MMAYPTVTIELRPNLLTQADEIQVRHNDVSGGWPVVVQLLIKAQEAAVLEAFKQLTQQQSPILFTSDMPKERL